MKLEYLFSLLICLVVVCVADAEQTNKVGDGISVAQSDWPWWRGPHRNGTADPNQNPPLNFGAETNVIWKSAVPGRGHGSPTVMGKRVFLATADESGKQWMLCYERATGEQLWKTVVHANGGMQKNKKSSAASSTPACDGSLVFICFPSQGALYASALTVDGDLVWQQKISDYTVHQGYGASPALYQDLVIVSADNKGGGMIAALDRKSGDFVWKRERPEKPNYPSPTLLNVAGEDQLIMVGCDMVVSYDPRTGATNWETDGATTECVTSTLTDGVHVYTSGGYPKNHMSAIKADGSGEVAWSNGSRLYVPSLVIHDGYLFGVLDAGIATCWNASTGEEMWKSRLGGTFTSSPVLVGDQIFIGNEAGEFFVFRASPDSYKQLSKNQLGDSQIYATPTIVGGRIYHRVGEKSSEGRQEWLYCLGES